MSNIKKRLGSGAAAVALAVGVGVVGLAAPAQAGTVYTIHVSNPGAMGCAVERYVKVEELKNAGAQILAVSACEAWNDQMVATITYYI